MGMFTNKNLETLDELLVTQLQDLYDAEQRLVSALPKMEKAADAKQLKNAFNHHLKETKEHVSRLEKVFQMVGKQAATDTCQAMKGLIDEGEEMIKAKGDPAVKDAALVAAGQRVEHYEIAGYGTARALANTLGHQEAAKLLQQTLDEEAAADRTLTEIAESYANVQSPQA